MKAQMVKWGNSLAVRIPKPIIEEAASRKAISWKSNPATGRSSCAGPPKYRPWLNSFLRLPRIICTPRFLRIQNSERKELNGDSLRTRSGGHRIHRL